LSPLHSLLKGLCLVSSHCWVYNSHTKRTWFWSTYKN
jgi:hypothetical protein